MITIGPITIMSTHTRRAYSRLANAAYCLHQTIWYADDLNTQAVEIRNLDERLSEALAWTPPEDIKAD